jgi:hypothetical protein
LREVEASSSSGSIGAAEVWNVPAIVVTTPVDET